MQPFTFVESETPEGAVAEVARKPEAVFFGGGTSLVDLMKLDVIAPGALVSVNHLPFSDISVADDGITVGANVRNSDLAHHQAVRQEFPVLSEALLAGASAQLRNMATTAGNLLYRKPGYPGSKLKHSPFSLPGKQKLRSFAPKELPVISQVERASTRTTTLKARRDVAQAEGTPGESGHDGDGKDPSGG